MVITMTELMNMIMVVLNAIYRCYFVCEIGLEKITILDAIRGARTLKTVTTSAIKVDNICPF